MTNPEWKRRIAAAVEKLGALRYFPPAEGAHRAVMELLYRMVETPDQLDWLVVTMIDRVGEWKGTAELRGVYCTRFKPLDGVEGVCGETPGFTATELEMAQPRGPLALPGGLGDGVKKLAEGKKLQ